MIGIVDYGLGNLRSVAGAFERIGATYTITGEGDELVACDKLVLPGVGAFGDGMANLRARGLDSVLDTLVVVEGRPILGICLGAQLMTRCSDEFGEHAGLGWFDIEVRRFDDHDGALRIPHVGWDDIEMQGDSPLFAGIGDGALFYYVHSHHMVAPDDTCVIGTCDYGGRFAAALARDNIFAVQFHPEKSQRDGLTVLENFLAA